MTVKGPQWHYQRCLIILSAVFLAITILCSSATAQSYGPYSITGKVVDRNGNTVPGAFVELIMNGSILKIANNPQLSGDRQTKPFGSFNFTGLAPGEYTILAEITTPASGKFNGSKSVSVVSRTVDANVTLAGYKYAYSTPTPIPTMQAAGENTIAITPEPLASISSVTTDSVSGGLFKSDNVLLMIGSVLVNHHRRILYSYDIEPKRTKREIS